MNEWRQGWHTEVRHWPVSTRKRLMQQQSDAHTKDRQNFDAKQGLDNPPE